MASSVRRASKSADINVAPVESLHMRPRSAALAQDSGSPSSSIHSKAVGAGDGTHGDMVYSGAGSSPGQNGGPRFRSGRDLLRMKKADWFAYVKTRQFWLVLFLGQILAVCITGTNTLSGLLAGEGTNIPAFQSLFNYVLLNLIYTSYTIYKYGFKGWLRLIYKDGWRFFILAFCDVEGNYFTVLAYRYTTILSCQLFNFFAIVVVVLISLIFLGVRYHIAQYLGILVCIGGMGVIFGSDHLNGSYSGEYPNAIKGDFWALGGAAFYGLSNVFEEFLVSERPLYEVVGQLAFWGLLINGTQAGIFDRASFRSATWNSAVGGYLTGYTLVLGTFYSLAPIMFRLSSAAFFNLSLLTANFWGACVGVKVFGLTIHWMYPIALVLIILGHIIYFSAESVLGEARKPWLGPGQEKGVSGIGTAKLQDERGGLLGLGRRWGLWGQPRHGRLNVPEAAGAGVV